MDASRINPVQPPVFDSYLVVRSGARRCCEDKAERKLVMRESKYAKVHKLYDQDNVLIGADGQHEDHILRRVEVVLKAMSSSRLAGLQESLMLRGNYKRETNPYHYLLESSRLSGDLWAP
ncbi:predicted protein [Coccidioides posadasii str. Silveira]|uniref:Predicted protein n=2 Tax=Coccidioides posadasii TaxID=199306 RepID=E9D3M9_COCPS|nr:predicted protein [Coccidioides posadasii str. Silveira]KMM65940.1 hypothetical protein CPAG_02281 [Coccidioides posadasii RMSCC 3488]